MNDDIIHHFITLKIPQENDIVDRMNRTLLEKANYCTLQVFECLAYIHIQDIYRLKLDLILNKCTFFGYERTTKSYRIWNPSTH
uniref:Retroviral polymerase SH3-like domain-containing protein n=1 Tax=Physcomitrium patens TaxID=3218 RepID=A0A2K1IV64_PHYPA|nr:hypothetical protein PHYPA_025112 [Physcomitrium patens]